jgi:hypothetical protein
MEMETLILQWQIMDSSNVSILTNDGSGNFTLKGNVGVGSGPYGISFGDIDGDGDLDIAVANYGFTQCFNFSKRWFREFHIEGECWGWILSSGYIIW